MSDTWKLGLYLAFVFGAGLALDHLTGGWVGQWAGTLFVVEEGTPSAARLFETLMLLVVVAGAGLGGYGLGVRQRRGGRDEEAGGA